MNIIAIGEVTKYGFRVQFFMEIDQKIKKENIASCADYSIIIVDTKG